MLESYRIKLVYGGGGYIHVSFFSDMAKLCLHAFPEFIFAFIGQAVVNEYDVFPIFE